MQSARATVSQFAARTGTAVLFLASASAERSAEPPNLGVDDLTFFVIVLVIGVATYHVLAITRIPYTAMLIVWGVFLGIANETYDRNWKLLGPGTESWQDISPSLLLTAFLPILLFAAAFGLEWHYVRRLIGSSLLLAGPGVLFGAAITAVLVKYTFPYDWTWVQCLLFGAIFSATDPVAVVAVLKEAGMPKKVRTLVDLEALLNDGAAYVIFVLLRVWAEGGHQNAGNSIRQAFRLTLGGPATGIAFGLAVTLWLRFMYNKPVAEISLTVAAAYGTYIVADQLFGVSPVLAVVFLGIWMAAKGVDHISRKVEHPLHVIWEELEFIANTIVFVLSGVVIAGRIYESATSEDKLIRASDWGYTLLLWVYLTVIRFAMIVICWPLLSVWGYVIRPKEAVVLGWSGLRGAVGLSLALFVLLDNSILDMRFRVLVFFHMGCIAFLTIIIQGTSMKPLLQSMKLTRTPAVKRSFLHNVLERAEEHSDEQLRFAKFDSILGDPDWQVVQQRAALEPRRLAWQASKLSSLLAGSTTAQDEHLARLARKLDRNMLLREQRTRLLLAVRQTYNDYFQDHYISTGQIYRLRVVADRGLENVGQGLKGWKDLQKACAVPAIICWAQRRTGWDGVAGKLARHALAIHLENAATLALAFCHAHQLAVQDFVRFEKLEGWDEAAAALGTAVQPLDDLLELMKQNVSEQVIAESKAEVQRAYGFVADLRDAFPEVLKGVKTAQLAQEMLIHKEQYLAEIAQTGLLEDTEVEQLQDLVEYKLNSLHFCPPRFPWPSIAKLLLAQPVFADLEPCECDREVLAYARISLLNPDDALKSGDDQEGACCLMLRGKVKLHPHHLLRDSLKSTASSDILTSQQDALVSNGTLLGVWPVLLGAPCPFEASAASICLVAEIPSGQLKRLAERHRCVRDAFWQSIGVCLALISNDDLFKGFHYAALSKIFRAGRVDKKVAGCQLQAAGTILLVAGSLQRQRKGTPAADHAALTRVGPCFISGGPLAFVSLTDVTVIHLPVALELAADQTGKQFAKSALASLTRDQSSCFQPDWTLERMSAPQPTTETSIDVHEDEAATAIAQRQSEAEASLSQNRRKSLAHGLLIHMMAGKGDGEAS